MGSWLVLQLADSAFPTGGFAHSSGLEAAAQLGEVKGADGARAFFEQALWQAGLGALPFVRAAHEDPSALPEHDALCHAFLSSHVANRASRTQGRAFVSTAARSFSLPRLTELHDAVAKRALHGHLAPLFGAALRALDLPSDDAMRLHLHTTLRGVASAAVRLGLAGPHEAQEMQFSMAPQMERVLHACRALPLSEIAQPSPLLDLFGALHDRLYARLFLS
jgi:urease accessory protein